MPQLCPVGQFETQNYQIKMSRQIKFRAWDAEQNKMIETFDGEYQIHVNEEDGTVYCGGHLPNGDWNEPPLMQFTGLYDKRRNEIFEGDILSEWTDTDEGMVQSHQQVFWCSIYGEWRLDSSFHQDKTFSDSLWQMLNDYECEITGNIYERAVLS